MQCVCMREAQRGGGIIVLLVMDVKGLKLDVIRTTKLYDILYMDSMERKDGAGRVWGVRSAQDFKIRVRFLFFSFLFSRGSLEEYSNLKLN